MSRKIALPLLAAAGFRAEAYDLAGQFESWQAGPEQLVPPRDHYDEDLFAGDLIAVISAGPTPVHLVGYSFAGIVVQDVAARRPDLVASITLLSTPPLAGQSLRGIKIVGALSNLVSARAAASVMLWGIRWNLNRAPRHRVGFVRSRLRLTRRASVDDAIGLMMHVPDRVAALSALSIPKLVVTGAHDLWPEALHRAFAARIGASVLFLAGGHSPSEHSPFELTRALVTLADATRA